MTSIRILRKYSLSGVLIDSCCPEDKMRDYCQQLKSAFLAKNAPVVFLERKIEDGLFSSVYVDHCENAKIAMRHLIDMGHRRIAHIAGHTGNVIAADRLRGYKEVLAENGVNFNPEYVECGDFSPNSGYIAMKSLLARRADFTAVFAANDQMAIGGIKAILSEGKSIPGNIAVIGMDNVSVSSMITPSLSSVHVPTYMMGRTAVQATMDILHNGGQPIQHKLSCNLVVRKSTDPYANGEWELFGW